MTTENTNPPVDETSEPEPILGIDLPEGATALSALGAADRFLVFPEGGGLGTITKDKLATPQSFTEQPVPGEFWIGNDNVSRQVYVRTFAGNFATATGEVVLATGARECKVDNGGMYNPHIPNFTMPGWYSINASNAYQFNIALWEGTLSILYDTTSAQFPVSTFSVTIKYTKA